jgi:HSP20 family protein
MDDDRKRRKDFWDDIFGGDFDEELKEMRKRIEELMRELMKEPFKFEDQPFVYGFSVRSGPDGKPAINGFGDLFREEDKERVREPLTDIIEKDEEILITLEVPGVEKEDIDVEVTENRARVSVEKGKRYYKDVVLPSNVDSSTTKATYKNGVLSITVKKKEGGRKVVIE